MDSPKKENAFMFFFIMFSIFASFALLSVLNSLGISDDVPLWFHIVFTQVVAIGVPCAVYLILHRHKIKEILPMRWPGLKNAGFVVALSILILPAGWLLNFVSATLFGSPITDMMADMADQSGIIPMLVLVPILPSIFEEVALRGIVFSGYSRVRVGVAVAINGLFFGIMHLNFNQFSYAFLLGAVMCLFMYYTKSLWAPILSHFVINLFAAVMQAAALNVDLEALEEASYGGPGVLATLIVFGVIAAIFSGIFFVVFARFKKYNIKRNDAKGIATDTYKAAKEKAEPLPTPFDWGFWATLGLGFGFMILAHYAQLAQAY